MRNGKLQLAERDWETRIRKPIELEVRPESSLAGTGTKVKGTASKVNGKP